MFSDLAGKIAFVTGASSGLGADFARALARHGVHVALGARRAEPLRQLEAELIALGVRAKALELDVTRPASAAAAFAAGEDALGPINILVNNAGVTLTKPALDCTEEDFDRVLDVNLNGAFTMCKLAGASMRARTGGSIINIASILGMRQAAQVASYAVSKAALVQMTKSLALEWARHGIRVNALAPGYIETELNRAFFETEAGKAMVKRIPQRRLGRSEELIGPLLLLASEASSYMTGAVIAADGGHLVSTL